MRMRFHGGQCCGIRHLSDLGQTPKIVLREVKEFGVLAHNTCEWCLDDGLDYCECDPEPDSSEGQESVNPFTDKNGAAFHTDHDIAKFYLDSLPQETCASRMARYIKGLMGFRPNSLVEVVISIGRKDLEGWGYDQSKWIPVLRYLGFRRITEFVNENSQNTLQVYHLRLWEKNSKRYETKLDKYMESQKTEVKLYGSSTIW